MADGGPKIAKPVTDKLIEFAPVPRGLCLKEFACFRKRRGIACDKLPDNSLCQICICLPDQSEGCLKRGGGQESNALIDGVAALLCPRP